MAFLEFSLGSNLNLQKVVQYSWWNYSSSYLFRSYFSTYKLQTLRAIWWDLDFISMFLFLQRMVDEEDVQFEEEYINARDPSILHFLLASGDEVRILCLKQILLNPKLYPCYFPRTVNLVTQRNFKGFQPITLLSSCFSFSGPPEYKSLMLGKLSRETQLSKHRTVIFQEPTEREVTAE